MADSAIGWTDKTWNPTTGCTKISMGCDNCYAETQHERLTRMGQPKYQKPFSEFVQHPNEIDKPLHWKKPCRIFVNSMSDLFHNDADYPFLSLVFDTMMLANWHQYQILTKRPKNMRNFIDKYLEQNHLRILPNHIWMGTSVETEAQYYRLGHLSEVKASVYFASFEPLLSKINLDSFDAFLDWAIIGGESGANHRPMKKEWAVDLIGQLIVLEVPVFFKQWGGFRAGGDNTIDGHKFEEYPRIG